MQTKLSFWKTATVVGMMAILVGVSILRFGNPSPFLYFLF